MESYTSFAVAGAGPTIGTRLVAALLARGVRVLVLTRATAFAARSAPPGTTTAAVDYTDVAALADVLRAHGVQVLVSALAYGALDAQYPLADAARSAGVSLFVPSEYGMPTEHGTEGHLVLKSRFAEYVHSLGIPTTRIYNGMFAEFVPWLVGLDSGEFLIAGAGTQPASFTALDDVAGFLAHVLTTLPPSALANATFRIEGARTSLAEIGAHISSTRDTPVRHVDKLPETMVKQAFLHNMFEAGRASAGWDNVTGTDDAKAASSGNGVWEGHQWKSVPEALGL